MKYLLSLILFFSVVSFSYGQDDEKVYISPEVSAQYKGGPKAWTKFLNANLKYPYEASKSGFSGPVFLSFIVDKKGRVKKPVATILKDRTFLQCR